MWINLPYGGTGAGFDAVELKDYMLENNLTYIIQGACKCTLNQHKKPKSLDYWLRKHKNTQHVDTMQAVDKVIRHLVKTGLFYEKKCICPTSGQPCNALVLTTRPS